MTMLLVIIWVVIVAKLLFVLGMRPERTHRSWSELVRTHNEPVQRRERLLANIFALRRVIVGLLLIAAALLGLLLWQVWGMVAVVAVWLVGGIVVRNKSVHRFIQVKYTQLEPKLLDFVESVPLLGTLFRAEDWKPRDQKLESPEQLLHLVQSSGHVLSDEQQIIIRRGLDWHTTTVASIMTPREAIVSVKQRELLGPLVLDDLHKSTHNRFPVTSGTIDTIVGVLSISELLEIDGGKTSPTAESAMSTQVLRIESDEPLPAALALLQASHQHMLIVIDPDGKTVGIVTLADVTGSLLGL